MEERVKNLEEQVEFLKDVVKFYCVNQLDKSMFKDWKNKKGVFQSVKLVIDL